jgi:translation initiation factor eIF-2B subunit epsilon
LASNGVEQVIIITGSELTAKALEDYLPNSQHNHQRHKNTNTTNAPHHNNNNSNNSNNSSGLEILFLKDTSLTNAGDALRELYKRNWIRASKQALPFLLVSGDVVADLDLRDAMKAHKDRQSHDSAAVMTVVLKPTANNIHNNSTNSNNTTTTTTTTASSIVPRASDLVVGLVGAFVKTVATADAQASEKDPSIDDRRDYRIMYYDNGGHRTSTVLPCSFLTTCQTQCSSTTSSTSTSTSTSSSGGLEVRHDLLDTGIAICSPDVLGRLEDEFDYLDLAHDFVTNSVAEEEDGLQTRIYAHVLEDGDVNGYNRSYAARALDFQTYHAISRDLLQRWAYPTCADRMLGADQRYKLVKVADHNHHFRKTAAGGGRPLRSLDNTNENENSNSNSNNNSNRVCL